MVKIGTGRWNPDTYTANAASRIASGTSFSYSSSIHSGATPAAASPLLDPKTVAGPTSPLAGALVREARDTVESPASLPILIAFDETGSMQTVPYELVKKLPELYNLIVLKGYVADPQFAFGAYGDAANHETAPLQIGQFEADNKADETLDALYLEANGGANRGETAALVWYYAAKHTATDAWEKRSKKGYLFTIGDEVTFGVTPEMVTTYIGPDHGMQGEMTPKEVFDLASKTWEVYHLIIDNYTATSQGSERFYTDFMGDHAIVLQSPDTVCEIIATVIGLGEGAIDLDEGLDNLDDVGAGSSRAAVGKALARVGSASTGGGSVVVAERGPADLDVTDGDDVERI